MLTAINRHTHTQTHSRFILGLQHAHCDNLSCVFHNRLLVLHCLPIVCISHPAAMWWWHICIRIPHHVRKYFLCTPSTSVFICLICVSLNKSKSLKSSPSPFPKHTSPLPATSSASAVPECPLILPGCHGDSNGECQHGRRWGLGCCPISSPRPAHWIVLRSLTPGGGVENWRKGGYWRKLLSNPSC